MLKWWCISNWRRKWHYALCVHVLARYYIFLFVILCLFFVYCCIFCLYFEYNVYNKINKVRNTRTLISTSTCMFYKQVSVIAHTPTSGHSGGRPLVIGVMSISPCSRTFWTLHVVATISLILSVVSYPLPSSTSASPLVVHLPDGDDDTTSLPWLRQYWQQHDQRSWMPTSSQHQYRLRTQRLHAGIYMYIYIVSRWHQGIKLHKWIEIKRFGMWYWNHTSLL